MAPANPGTIRAKFYVQNVEYSPTVNPTCATVVLLAATDEAPENKTWANLTPAGVITMSITNMDAVGAFVVGAPYFVDFTRADLPGVLPLAPRDDGLASANDKVLALVPNADPAHVDVAIQAFDKVALQSGDHEQQKGAAVMAAIGAGADEATAHAVAAAIPVLLLSSPSSTETATDPQPSGADPAPGA